MIGRLYNMTVKICTKCGGEPKPLTEFHKDASQRDGLRFQCKACVNAASAKWKAVNTDKLKAYNAKRYAADPEGEKARNAKWYAANPEKKKARDSKYYAANAKKIKANVIKWCSANPDANRINVQNRRARKLENGGTLSKGLSAKLFKRQRGKCACGCSQPLGNNFHRDHIMPLALGGTNTDDNMQLLRQRCNNQKHAKHPIDFMQSRGFLL